MLLPATAIATPPVSAEVATLAQSSVDGVDYITREITIQPGGSTGWHYHDGRVFGVIREGTLTRTLANCQWTASSRRAAPVAEGSGPDHVHLGRNLEPIPLVMWWSTSSRRVARCR